jgi:4-aminobutyrate aminotransferase-like enzyme
MYSISYYPNPLKIERALGAYMIEENGQVNLDCINNVSHIGHCHPKYVSNLQKQLEILNTNSRFIYEPLNNAIKKLLSKLPS